MTTAEQAAAQIPFAQMAAVQGAAALAVTRIPFAEIAAHAGGRSKFDGPDRGCAGGRAISDRGDRGRAGRRPASAKQMAALQAVAEAPVARMAEHVAPMHTTQRTIAETAANLPSERLLQQVASMTKT
jgi:hypothetical protein